MNEFLSCIAVWLQGADRMTTRKHKPAVSLDTSLDPKEIADTHEEVRREQKEVHLYVDERKRASFEEQGEALRFRL